MLVADDDPDIRMMLRIVLTEPGILVREAVDGDEALALARVWEPHLSVLDHRMPGLTGTEVAAQLLADGHTGRLAVFSAHLDHELAMRVAELDGEVDAIAKADVGGLVAVLREVQAAA